MSTALHNTIISNNQICHLTAGDNVEHAQDIKISVSTINDHLRCQKTVITEELLRKLNNNSLEWIHFQRMDSIRLSCFKSLVISFIDFLVYRHSFTSLLVYCWLLQQNIEDLTKMINSERDQKHLKT